MLLKIKMHYLLIIFFGLFFKTHDVFGQTLRQAGLGEPCSVRSYWGLVKISQLEWDRANAGNSVPMEPAWSDATYLQYKQTGIRDPANTMLKSRLYNMKEFVLAECIDYKGVYIKKIEEYLNGIMAQKSWSFSAHDTDLSYFNNGRYFIELMSGIFLKGVLNIQLKGLIFFITLIRFNVSLVTESSI